MVHGQLLKIQVNKKLLLQELDMFEGFKGELGDEYVRIKTIAHYNDQQIEAWVYLYNQSTKGLTMITGGHYGDYLQETKKTPWRDINT